MSAPDALVFCRRRFEAALERAGDLDHAASILRDDDAEAERAWTDGLAREVRQRDLVPHRDAAERQRASLRTAIEAGRDLLAALDDTLRAEQVVIERVTAARAAVDSARSAIAGARTEVDQARAAVQTAESECAAARQLVSGL